MLIEEIGLGWLAVVGFWGITRILRTAYNHLHSYPVRTEYIKVPPADQIDKENVELMWSPYTWIEMAEKDYDSKWMLDDNDNVIPRPKKSGVASAKGIPSVTGGSISFSSSSYRAIDKQKQEFEAIKGKIDAIEWLINGEGQPRPSIGIPVCSHQTAEGVPAVHGHHGYWKCQKCGMYLGPTTEEPRRNL